MPAATLTEKGQVVIPAEIRARHGPTPGTQVEFVDEGGTIRLVVRRRVTPSDPDDTEAKRQRPRAKRTMLESPGIFVPLTVIVEFEWVIPERERDGQFLTRPPISVTGGRSSRRYLGCRRMIGR